MNLTSSTRGTQALRLALELATSESGRISRKTLSDHFAGMGKFLVGLGLLKPEGHSTSIATQDDLAAAVEWSPERDSYGYFSETDGWIDLAADTISTFALQVHPLVRLLTAQIDLQPPDLFNEIKENLLWEVGSGRLPGRAKRVQFWVGRRLHNASVWQSFVHATRDRPTQELRVVLHLAEREIPDAPFVANHAIVAVGSIISAENTFQIDAAVMNR